MSTLLIKTDGQHLWKAYEICFTAKNKPATLKFKKCNNKDKLL